MSERPITPVSPALVAEIERLQKQRDEALAEVERLRDLCERAVEALRYEANPVCDEWDDYMEARRG